MSTPSVQAPQKRWASIAVKFFLICLSFAIPLGVLLKNYIGTRQEAIDFGAKELEGDALQRPLQKALRAVSLHRWYAQRIAAGEAGLDAALNAAKADGDRAMTELAESFAIHGESLKFTKEGLATAKKSDYTLENAQKWWSEVKGFSGSWTDHDKKHADLIVAVKTMIAHAGDTSNLILDPDLDSYYLMDVTLLALPQAQDRVQTIANYVEGLGGKKELSAAERTQLEVYAAMFNEADLARIQASSDTAINNDESFYGPSPTLERNLTNVLADLNPKGQALIASLRSYASDPASFSLADFRKHKLETLESLYAFHAVAFDEEDWLLQNRINDFMGKRQKDLTTSLVALALAIALASWIGRNIVKRVRRIQDVTREIGAGNMTARVRLGGADELAGLANSFDAMTDKIDEMQADLARTNASLEDINGNLEGIVAERTAQIQTILDNVVFGFIMVDRNGMVQPGFTKSCWTLLDTDELEGRDFCDALKMPHAQAAEYRMGLDQVFDDILPAEVLVEQLPKRFVMGPGKVLRVDARPVRDKDGNVGSALLSISDITDLERAEQQSAQNQMLVTILAQRDAFTAFVQDTWAQIALAGESIDLGEGAIVRRVVHTIKGNAGSFGMHGLARVIHEIESQPDIAREDLRMIEQAFKSFLDANHRVLGVQAGQDSSTVRVSNRRLAELESLLRSVGNRDDLMRWCAKVRLEPAEAYMSSFEQTVARVAEREDKWVDYSCEGGDIVVDPKVMQPIFRELIHVIRNAVDHGLEAPSDRGSKSERGYVKARVSETETMWTVEISDDGRGIDADKLAQKAVEKGVISAEHCARLSREQKLALVFEDGFSTKDTVSEISGRGVGMSAVRATVQDAGGTIDIETKTGEGSRFIVVVPKPSSLVGYAKSTGFAGLAGQPPQH